MRQVTKVLKLVGRRAEYWLWLKLTFWVLFSHWKILSFPSAQQVKPVMAQMTIYLYIFLQHLCAWCLCNKSITRTPTSPWRAEGLRCYPKRKQKGTWWESMSQGFYWLCPLSATPETTSSSESSWVSLHNPSAPLGLQARGLYVPWVFKIIWVVRAEIPASVFWYIPLFFASL